MILTKALADQLSSQRFRDMITAARVVEVKVNSWAPADSIYALDIIPEFAPDEMRKIIVVCAPQHRETAEEMVRLLRGSTWTNP